MRESCYWQQTWPPPRVPRASLTTSLLPAMQHLFVNRSSIINRLMWISNLLRRLTWQTRPEAPYLSVPHPRAQLASLPSPVCFYYFIWCPNQVLVQLYALSFAYIRFELAGLYRSLCCLAEYRNVRFLFPSFLLSPFLFLSFFFLSFFFFFLFLFFSWKLPLRPRENNVARASIPEGRGKVCGNTPARRERNAFPYVG